MLNRVLFLILIPLVLSACTVSTHETVAVVESASAVERQVEKVLGLTPKVSETEIETFPRSFAILPLENTTQEAAAPIVLRSVLQGHMSTRNYQFMHWKKVDELVGEYQIDQEVIQSDVVSVMSKLGVDGAIRGKVLDYEKLFVGIYSQITLAVYVEMINLQGEVIWSGEFDVASRAGGISVTPWGTLLNVSLATLNLSDESLYAAADELSREASDAMPEPPYFSGSQGPIVTSVIHDGGNKVLRYSDVIKVGMRGASNAQATVIIEGMEVMDMQETEPGVYFAEIPVASSWQQKNVSVYGRLTDDLGVSTKRLSEFGLLSFDNIAPNKPTLTTASVSGGRLSISLNSDSIEPQSTLFLMNGDLELLLEFNSESAETVVSMADFETRDFYIYSKDLAGNSSEKTRFSVTAYPFDELSRIKRVSTLPNVIDEPLLLTAVHPIVVEQLVTLTETGKLYIAGDNELRFAASGSIEVFGELSVFGSNGNVLFTPLSKSSPPTSFLSLQGTSNVLIQGTIFEGADIAITANSGSVGISDTTFRNNRYSALMLEGTGKASLTKSNVDGSSTSGVVLAEKAKLTISDGHFSNNEPFHIQNSSVYPVVLGGTTFEPAMSPTTVLGEIEQP